MRSLFVLPLLAVAYPSFADNLLSDGRQSEILDRWQEIETRGPDFPKREREFLDSDLSDPDRLSRFEDMNHRWGDYREMRGGFIQEFGPVLEHAGKRTATGAEKPADAHLDEGTAVATQDKCEPATRSEKDAFCATAGLGDKACGKLDFSCGKPASMEVASIDESAGTGAASPIGNYKLTWQSNGEGWTTIDRGYPASGHTGYGDDIWDNGKNVSTSGGVTTLKVTRCNEGGKSMCGAEITTRGIKDFTHGYVETEAKVSDGKSLFPAALWMIGEGTWPNSGEIDSHEAVLNGRDDNKVFFSAHWAGCGGKCQISDANPATVANKGEWHRYGVKRTPDSIEQYVDGKMTGRITRAEAAAKGGNYQVIFDAPMHLRADIGSGGAWAQHASGQRDEGSMQLRNFKVYE